VRNALGDALSGDLDFVDGMVFPHTCDSIQRLSDVWRLNVPHGFHLDAVLPVKLDTDSAREYMAAVMETFKADLESSLERTIAPEALRDTVALYNGIRAQMGRLYALRRQRPGLIPGGDFHAMLRASMAMDRRDYLAALTDLAGELSDAPQEAQPLGKRVFLSGGMCDMPDIYSLIDGAGGSVVGDDLCTGSRQLTGRIDTDGDTVSAIAERYSRRAICPAKHAGITARGDDLVRMVGDSGAAGVVFIFLKFCDPHAFDYPYLKQMLGAEGIPSLLVELEDGLAGSGQLRTRVEAFIEMI
jgi:benzoyl-CoA reductase/2-hydroxyglutaryl-CoA dehydratase subunit BcrC/BadD/HgdB